MMGLNQFPPAEKKTFSTRKYSAKFEIVLKGNAILQKCLCQFNESHTCSGTMDRLAGLNRGAV